MKHWIQKPNFPAFLFFGIYLLVICYGYHLDNKVVTINNLASDNWSIMPMIQKQQDTTLFAKDQFLYDHRVIYAMYPIHIFTSLAFAELAGGDAMVGYAWFSEVTLFVYLLLWFALVFYLTRSGWLSAFIAILARGILWPPGKEIWGAGELQFFLPRTVFAALVPLALILIFAGLFHRQKKKVFLFAGFLMIGLLGNEHPISGMGVGMAAMLALVVYLLVHGQEPFGKKVWTVLGSGFAFLAGIGPYLIPYLVRAANNSKETYDKAQFKALISERISGMFTEPWSLYLRYVNPQWLVLIGGAVMLSWIAWLRQPSLRGKIQWLWYFSASTLVIPMLFYGMEKALNSLGFPQINISYELMRTSKFVIIGSYLLVALGIYGALGAKRVQHNGLGFAAVAGFLCFCVLAKGPLKALPVARFDFFRSQLPNAITGNEYLPYTYGELDSAAAWIKENTPLDATFAAPPQIRAGAMRSIPFDYKGASILLEFNKPKFIDWALKNQELEKLGTDEQKLAFYRKLPVDYLLTNSIYSSADSLVQTFGNYRLYRLHAEK